MRITPSPGLAAAFLFLLPAAAYWQVSSFEFVNFDDDAYVTDNPHAAEGLSAAGLRSALVSVVHGHWHPVTMISHMADVELFGMRPGAHHLVSLLWHLLNVQLLFAVLTRLTGRWQPSALAAALFAVHPLQAETVAWVSERKNLLSMAFGLGSLWWYAEYARTRSRAAYAKCAAALFLGLASKPSLVVWPAVMLVLDFWPLARRERWPRLALEKLPLLALTLPFCLTTFFESKLQSLDSLPFQIRFENALVSYARTLRRLVLPYNLAGIYPYPDPGWLRAWAPACAAGLAAFTAWVWRARRDRPHLLAGWLLFLGVQVPTIGLVQVGPQSMADRYAYFSLLGPFAALAWEASRLGRAGWALGAVAAAALTVAASFQARHWRDGEALFRRALAATGPNYVAHNGLATALLLKGRLAEADEHARLSLEINPRFGAAYASLGFGAALQGRLEEGEALLRRALELHPDNELARKNLELVRYVRASGAALAPGPSQAGPGPSQR